jgi:glutamyl-tRNA synthetase
VQVLMHQALGNELPRFAHIPFVSAPGTKEKLSKRDSALKKYRKNPQFKRLFDLADERLPRIGLGSSETLNPVMVEFYEQIGYLPEAVLNALSRLGWSLDDRTEILSLQTVVENFTLDRVIKSPAGLDPDKLDSYQLHWMGTKTLDEKIDGCVPFLKKAGLSTDRDHLACLIATLGERLKIFSDIIDYREYFVADDALEYDEKAFEKRLTNAPDSVDLLRNYRDVLAGVEPFDAENTEKSLKEFVELQGAKLGDVIHALRVAVTGKPQGPGMFDCLALLGKESCLRRIDRALRIATEMKPAIP